MLLCRRILFHLEFATFPRTPTNILPTSTRSFASTLRANGPQRHTGSRPDAPLPTLSASLLQQLSAPSNRSVDHQERPDKITERLSDLQAYKHLRTLDRPSLAALPLPSYFRLLKRASRLELGGLISQLIDDILELFPESQHVPAVLAILSSSILPIVPPATILVMLQHLHRSPEQLDRLARRDVTALVRTFADAPPDQADLSLVELIFPLLLAHLRKLPQPDGQAVLTYQPPDIIHASFAFLDKLLNLSQQQQALEIFQILVNSGNIPSEAVQTIPDLQDFALIVRSSLVRASTHWHWRPLAGQILSPLLKTAPSPSPPTISLTVDTIYACLSHPTAADLGACRSLICQIHPFSPVPNGVVRQFYTVAEEIDARQAAHALYSFTRSEETLKTHRYPCPRGSSLPWLLRHLLDENSYHAKELGQEVLDGNLIIRPESRTHVVGGLASRGHATLARALWDRFAAGKDRQQFIKDPSLMIRMVSLFHHLVKREEEIIEKRAGKGPFLDDELVQQRAEDFKSFLNLVLSEFAQAHSPMAAANHQILTSQARAFFIVGQFVQGFDTLKLLLQRRELPDLYDVNVTLTVMAEHDPRTAAQLIKRMTDRGLQPDHITFGTVLHHALAHGDMELVDEMVNRVREMKNSQLSYKSIVSLVRGSVAFSPDSTQRAKLHSVFSIIKSIGRSTVVATPHIGRYLVYAALRADDPLMAYTFWDFLLKDNAPWNDREQVFQRRLITVHLKKHLKGKWVKEDHAQVMLSQLQAQN
ncbi:hypothetical protein B0H17DRAFT_414776 [Mycena rosella]|uniref:Pentatricopeptide repeat-containing protein n=1 Tax=Mycena rosella TaxID=1033263 RepID=A0AAD7GL46_MYCRO|nr:hypothetical protein B0H17DRAFT_414776 [Mycena rosella]